MRPYAPPENEKSTSKEVLRSLVEHRGFEPLTSTLPVLRAPNCANAPWDYEIKMVGHQGLEPWTNRL